MVSGRDAPSCHEWSERLESSLRTIFQTRHRADVRLRVQAWLRGSTGYVESSQHVAQGTVSRSQRAFARTIGGFSWALRARGSEPLT